MKLVRQVPLSVVLFLFFLSVYLFTMSGTHQYGGELEKYSVAQSIVDRHSLAIRPMATRGATGVGGQTYSIYELGQTILEVPFYALGRVTEHFFSVADVNWITLLFVDLINPIVTALTCVLLYQTALTLGFQLTGSIIITLLFGVATIVWPYSRGLDREPIMSLLILFSFFALVRCRQTKAMRWLLTAGLASGYLVFVKFIQAVVIPPLLIYVAWLALRDQPHASARAKIWAIASRWLVFLLPANVFLGLQSIYALARFGNLYSGIGGTAFNVFDTILLTLRMGEPLVAIPGLLFSPDWSVFLYSPPLLLFPIAWFIWRKHKPAEAFLILVLILLEFFSAALRWEWWGGPRWGPRYLVQITALSLLPVAVLFETENLSRRKFWLGAAGILFIVGVFVQVVGAFTNERYTLDMTGYPPVFAAQLQLLLYGTVDSIVVYRSPTGLPFTVNPFGVVLISIVALTGIMIGLGLGQGSNAQGSWWIGLGTLVWVILIEAIAFIVWIVVPYPSILSAKADTRFVAANNLLADGKRCESSTLYITALESDTSYQREAADQIQKVWLAANGTSMPINNLALWDESDSGASWVEDIDTTITGEGSMKFTAAPGKDPSVAIISEPVGARPNTQYELSGWLKSLSIYGTGYGVVSIFEDNGDWGNGRTTDMKSIDETSGWQLFRKTITTLPTTRRLFIKMGLYKTYGTFWVDGVRLIKVDPSMPQPQVDLPPCKR